MLQDVKLMCGNFFFFRERKRERFKIISLKNDERNFIFFILKSKFLTRT